MSFHVPERHRVMTGRLATDFTYGHNGYFLLASDLPGRLLSIIASDGAGWEHVSVRALRGRRSATPTWAEMCQAKALFWDDEDAVVQFHPKRSEYVNQHPNVLHLWRPTEGAIPTPPPLLVGLRANDPVEVTR